MELYREISTVDKEHIIYKYLALCLIFASFAYEAYYSFVLHRTSIVGWGYSVLFLVLWFWRIGFTYTYILTENEFKIVRHGFGFSKTIRVDLHTVESFTNRYVRSFFRKTKISRYTHGYSSVDPRPQRLLVYSRKKALEAIIFKCDDELLAKLKECLPDKFLDFAG